MEIDWVAVYAAGLSSVLALGQLYQWLKSGPSASVQLLNPLNVHRFGKRLYELVVSNNGSVPIVIEKVNITVHEKRSRGPILEAVTFDTRSSWNPSLRSVPHPTKPNTSSDEANVIPVGGEFHQLLQPFESYDPTRHWVRAEVILRNSRSSFLGWAPPVDLSQEALK